MYFVELCVATKAKVFKINNLNVFFFEIYRDIDENVWLTNTLITMNIEYVYYDLSMISPEFFWIVINIYHLIERFNLLNLLNYEIYLLHWTLFSSYITIFIYKDFYLSYSYMHLDFEERLYRIKSAYLLTLFVKIIISSNQEFKK